MTFTPRLDAFWWSLVYLPDKCDRPCWYTWQQIVTKTRLDYPTYQTGGNYKGQPDPGTQIQPARRQSGGEGG